MLFASEKQSLASATTMYDSLIVKIFKKDLLANAKLVLQQVHEHMLFLCAKYSLVLILILIF